MKIGHQSRSGYVLVLTLGLLALASISLASIARFSMGLATSANTAADELQRRWGLLSVRHAFHERAAAFLDGVVPPGELNTPPWPKSASYSTTFRLGGQQFSVLVSDEDAKANLNMIAARSPDRAGEIIRRLDEGAGRLVVRPLPPRPAGRVFESWGQVFELANLPDGRQTASELIEATHQITLWGSRRLNLRRASDAVLCEIAGLALPSKEAGELVESRKHWGGGDVNALLGELDLRRPQLLAASRLLSNESQSYSLWIEIDNGQRTWSYQYVEDDGPVGFAW